MVSGVCSLATLPTSRPPSQLCSAPCCTYDIRPTAPTCEQRPERLGSGEETFMPTAKSKKPTKKTASKPATKTVKKAPKKS